MKNWIHLCNIIYIPFYIHFFRLHGKYEPMILNSSSAFCTYNSKAPPRLKIIAENQFTLRLLKQLRHKNIANILYASWTFSIFIFLDQYVKIVIALLPITVHIMYQDLLVNQALFRSMFCQNSVFCHKEFLKNPLLISLQVLHIYIKIELSIEI